VEDRVLRFFKVGIVRWVGLVGLTLFLLLAVGGAGAFEPADPDSLDRLGGKWKLDWDRSESFGPAMMALEVPWLVRQMAGLVSIQVTIEVEASECEACSPSLRISSKNPIRNTSRQVFLDGVSRPFTDVMGNESMDVFTWDPARGMEMVRERVLDSGKAARIYESRTVTDDLATMVSTMTVWVEGQEQASVRRILSRVD
jgi:hypothetical protein